MTQEDDINRGIEPLAKALSSTYANRKIQPLAEKIAMTTADDNLVGAELAAQEVLRSITAARVMSESLLQAERSATETLGFNPFAALGDLIGRGGDVTQTISERPGLGGSMPGRMLEARVVQPDIPAPEHTEQAAQPPRPPVEGIPVFAPPPAAPVTAPFFEAPVAPPPPAEHADPPAARVAEVAPAPRPEVVSPAAPPVLHEAPVPTKPAEPEVAAAAASPVVEAATAQAPEVEVVAPPPAEPAAADVPELTSAPVETAPTAPPAPEASPAEIEVVTAAEAQTLDVFDEIIKLQDPQHAELRRAVIEANVFVDKMRAIRQLIVHMRTSPVPNPRSPAVGLTVRQQKLSFAVLDVKENGDRVNEDKEAQVVDGFADLIAQNAKNEKQRAQQIKVNLSNSVGTADALATKVENGLRAPDPKVLDYTVLRIVDLIRLNPVTISMTPEDRTAHFQGNITKERYNELLRTARTPRLSVTPEPPVRTIEPTAGAPTEAPVGAAPEAGSPAGGESESNEKKNDVVIPELTKLDALKWVLHYVSLTDDRREELRELGISVPGQTARRLRQFVDNNMGLLKNPKTVATFARTHDAWLSKLDMTVASGRATIQAYVDKPELYNSLILFNGIDTPEKLEEFLKKVYKNR